MSLAVTSWFLDQARRQSSAPLRRFTLGGSDCSAWVLRWPTLRFRASTIDLGTTTLQLSNVERTFNTLVDCPRLLTTSAELALGFSHPESGPEYLSLFLGAPAHAGFEDGGAALRLQLQGKTRRLTDTALGSAVESGGLDFTTSAHHPADLAWTLVTSHGGLSAVQSDANPDIDYAEWQAWRDANEVRDERVRAYLTGERIYQVLDTLALMDSRVITFRGGRLRFRDAVEPFDAPAPFSAETVLDSALALDPARLTTRFSVEADYDPGKGSFTGQFTKVHSQAEADYGAHSARFSSRAVWFASGLDARYLAEDRVRFGHAPQPLLRVRTALAGGLELAVGDVVTWTDTHFAMTARPFRVLEQALHLDDGSAELLLEAARHRPWQRQATVSSQNLLVRALTAVASDRYLALAEQVGTHRLVALDGDGAFQPVGPYGSALLSLGGGGLLLGGAPSSGGLQAVLQRSSDAGSSTTVVSSLAPGVPVVTALFEVRSGTCLAACTSGGIFRSTDAGSSWALTQTISGAFHVQRFFRPCSGTLWGGTGLSDTLAGTGLHLWESTDDGVSWTPRHTVHASGTYWTGGLYRLSDNQWLLGHYGDEFAELAVLRGTLTAPDSIAWTVVLSSACFAVMQRTDSGHLLFGFDEEATLAGGSIYRSLDEGLTWIEDARLAKRGNIALLRNGDGSLEAFVAHMSVGPRTDRYRNYTPHEIA